MSDSQKPAISIAALFCCLLLWPVAGFAHQFAPALLELTETASGDISVRALGWQADGTKGLWRIEQDVPLAFTLLSVTTEIKVND